MAITLNPGATAGLVGTLPPPQYVADFTDGWIDLSVNGVDLPKMYNFSQLQLSVVPGLLKHRLFSYMYYDVINYEGGGTMDFTSESAYVSGQINLWRMGAQVGTLPIKLGCAVIPASLLLPTYFAGSVATQTFTIIKDEIAFLGLGKSTIGKGPMSVIAPFDGTSRNLPYVECSGDFDSVTVNLSAMYSNWYHQDGVAWANFAGGFYLGILSTQ